jgi:hypothetical protein
MSIGFGRKTGYTQNLACVDFGLLYFRDVYWLELSLHGTRIHEIFEGFASAFSGG